MISDDLPARPALALAHVSGKPAGEPCCRLDPGTYECQHCEAREVLREYRIELVKVECHRDLTDPETEALRVICEGVA